MVTNAGIGAGSAIGAIALQADTRGAYLAMIPLDALTFVVTAALLATLPTRRRRPGRRPAAPDAPAPRAFTDRPYLAITVLNAILTLQFGIMEVGLPLWIAGHTRAPRPLVSAVLLVNTVMIVALQVRAAATSTRCRPRAGRPAFRSVLGRLPDLRLRPLVRASGLPPR